MFLGTRRFFVLQVAATLAVFTFGICGNFQSGGADGGGVRLGDGPEEAGLVEVGTEGGHGAGGVRGGVIGGGIVERPAGSGILLGGELVGDGEERESAESDVGGGCCCDATEL